MCVCATRGVEAHNSLCVCLCVSVCVCATRGVEARNIIHSEIKQTAPEGSGSTTDLGSCCSFVKGGWPCNIHYYALIYSCLCVTLSLHPRSHHWLDIRGGSPGLVGLRQSREILFVRRSFEMMDVPEGIRVSASIAGYPVTMM